MLSSWKYLSSSTKIPHCLILYISIQLRIFLVIPQAPGQKNAFNHATKPIIPLPTNKGCAHLAECSASEQTCTNRGFNNHQQPTKRVGYFTQRSWLIFSKIEPLCALHVHCDQNHVIFCTQFSAQNAGNRLLGHWKFWNFLGEQAPKPTQKMETKSSLLIQSVTLIKFTNNYKDLRHFFL